MYNIDLVLVMSNGLPLMRAQQALLLLTYCNPSCYATSICRALLHDDWIDIWKTSSTSCKRSLHISPPRLVMLDLGGLVLHGSTVL